MLSKKNKLGDDDVIGSDLRDEDREGDMEENKYDHFGNPIEEDEDEDINDNEKIKNNLKNSSKVYYAITHTV